MSRGTEHMYTQVHLCTIVGGFCTVLRGGRGRGRDAALLQPPATLPAGDNSVQLHYEVARTGCWRCHRAQTTRMDEAPSAAARSRRQFAKTLEGRTKNTGGTDNR